MKIGTGQLASATALQLLAGANVAALRNTSGGWEVIQFTTATLVAAQTYQLSGLLRGQAGTEDAMEPLLAAGAPFVVLSASLAAIGLTAAQVGLPLNWRIGPAAKDLGSSNYVQVAHAYAGMGARPLSPVRLRGVRSGGDLALSWIRRTRLGGDSWACSDVPLAEDSERYEVDILAGATVKRTLNASTPDVTYTAAMQVADFGAALPSISIRIYQISAIWGRGSAATATL
jgi:hypothetical protein